MADSMVIFSYIPLMRFSTGFRSVDEAQKIFQNNSEPSGCAIACIWSKFKDGSIGPIFLYKDADKIIEHLNEWSENKPTDWFKISIYSIQNQYQIVLIPNLEQSLERQKLVYKLQFMKDFPENIEIKFIYVPLTFYGPNKTFEKVKHMIPKDKISFGIMDESEFKPDLSMSETAVTFLGQFEITDSNVAEVYLKENLND